MVTTAGRRKREDERSILAKTPAEIVLLLSCIAVMVTLEAAFGSNYENNFDMLCTAVAAATLVITSIALGVVLFLVIKLRDHNLWSSSILCLLYRIIRWTAGHAKRFFGGFPLVWKTVLVVTVILLFNLAALGIMSGTAWFLWAGAIFVMAVLTAQKMKRLKDGGRHCGSRGTDEERAIPKRTDNQCFSRYQNSADIHNQLRGFSEKRRYR